MTELKQNGDEQAKRTKGDSGAVARDEDLQPTWTDKAGNVHRKRILTGDRTTGKLHLGHYVGSLRNRVKLQGQYDTFILMADIQALTTHWENPKILKESVREVALDYLAAGLDPYTGGEDDGSKAKIVVQSAVPAIAELTILYGLITPMGLLKSNPTTKAEAEQYGMAADSESLNAVEHYEQVAEDQSPLQACRDYFDSEHIHGMTEEDANLAIVVYRYLKESHPEMANWVFPPFALELLRYSLWLDVSGKQELEKYKHIYEAVMQDVGIRRQFSSQMQKSFRKSGLATMTYGFLGYPVSQAADITFVNAHLVPVGEDQVPHIELTREIVRRMNSQYGGRRRILTVPQALVGGGTLKGLDGNAKMSKSLGNAIYLSETDAEIWKKIKGAVTDPQRVRRDDPGRPEVCTIFEYHQRFNAQTEPVIAASDIDVPPVEETAKLCRSAGIGCVDCKKHLAAKLKALLDPMRERRSKWEKDIPGLMDILAEGTRRGCEEGNATVDRVKSAMHVDYWKKK